jgi:hypothetical protein
MNATIACTAPPLPVVADQLLLRVDRDDRLPCGLCAPRDRARLYDLGPPTGPVDYGTILSSIAVGSHPLACAARVRQPA